MDDKEPLVYNGHAIRAQGDHLCLTDMWHAAGEDPSKAPSRWIKLEQAQDFIEFIGENVKGRNPPFDLVRTDRGGRDPGTWAHWQIGMAYAKYLEPGFHAWCNEVVRAYMEGTLVLKSKDPFAGLSDKIADGIQRGTAPIVQRVDQVVQEMRAVTGSVQDLMAGHVALEAKVEVIGDQVGELLRKQSKQRKEIKPSTKDEHLYACKEFRGMCPCCHDVPVVDPNGVKLPGAQFDHFYASSMASAIHTWLICAKCHDGFTRGVVAREDKKDEFHAYQAWRKHLPPVQTVIKADQMTVHGRIIVFPNGDKR